MISKATEYLKEYLLILRNVQVNSPDAKGVQEKIIELEYFLKEFKFVDEVR